MEKQPMLKIVEEADRQMRESTEAMRPFLEQMAETQRIMEEAIAPAAKAIADFQKDITFAFPPKENLYIPLTYHEPVVHLAASDRKLLENVLNKKSVTQEETTHDFIYDKKEKMLSHKIDGQKISMLFSGGEAKRVNLFEKLNRERKYIETESLRDYLGSPTNVAVRKLVQAINDRVKEELKIEKLIVGRSNLGYRINPEIKIYTK